MRVQSSRLSSDEVSKSAFYDTISKYQSDRYRTPGKTWRRMVVQYTPLQLRHPTDKLPALSGLADEMRRNKGQKYLAGLWNDTLVPDMCWYLHEWNKKSSSQTPWRAPTWSWASVDGPVEYSQALYSARKPDTASKEYAEVVNAECSLAGPSPTGQVNGGFVELYGSLIPAYVKAEQEQVHADSLKLWWHSDNRCAIDEHVEYYLIPMVIVDSTFHGLVVKRTNSQEMIRIGLAISYHPPHLGTLEIPSFKKQKVRIV